MHLLGISNFYTKLFTFSLKQVMIICQNKKNEDVHCMGFQVCGGKRSVHHQTHPPPCKKSLKIYLEDLLTAAAATQSRRYIIHLFLRGYKTLVNYCLKCCPKTQRRSHTVCLSREWRHETTGQACNHSSEPCQCFYAFSFIDFFS